MEIGYSSVEVQGKMVEVRNEERPAKGCKEMDGFNSIDPNAFEQAL